MRRSRDDPGESAERAGGVHGTQTLARSGRPMRALAPIHLSLSSEIPKQQKSALLSLSAIRMPANHTIVIYESDGFSVFIPNRSC